MLSNWYGRSVLMAIVLAVVGAFSATYYFAYQRGLEDGRVGLPPVILADRAPIKIMNTQKPKIPTRHIDNVASGNGVVETSPADNATGAVESLLDMSPPVAKIAPAPKKVIAKKVVVKKPLPKKVLKKATPKNLYMVQVLAARNATQALSAYRRIQTKYKSLLTGREPLIKRVDLGKKGIYFRVNVPSFANKAAATQFCKQLKTQGQGCFVRKQS